MDFNKGIDGFFFLIEAHVNDQPFIYLSNVPVGWNLIISSGHIIEEARCNFVFINQFVGNLIDVLAVINISQFQNVLKLLFLNSVHHNISMVLCFTADVFN